MVARLLVAWAVVLLAGAFACSGTNKSSRKSSNDAVITIKAPIGSARVIVNDRDLGPVDILRRGIALSPGTHRLEVRHPKFHTHYQLLELSPRERRVIDIELAERLP